MPRSPDSTLPSRRLLSIVAIAPGPVLLAALEQAVQRIDDAPKVKTARLTDAATVIAEWRPFAVVVPKDVLAFDPAEFQALARTVGAEVIAHDSGAGAQDAAELLLPALEAALLLWATSDFARE